MFPQKSFFFEVLKGYGASIRSYEVGNVSIISVFAFHLFQIPFHRRKGSAVFGATHNTRDHYERKKKQCGAKARPECAQNDPKTTPNNNVVGICQIGMCGGAVDHGGLVDGKGANAKRRLRNIIQ